MREMDYTHEAIEFSTSSVSKARSTGTKLTGGDLEVDHDVALELIRSRLTPAHVLDLLCGNT
jgi:hypothetical protein